MALREIKIHPSLKRVKPADNDPARLLLDRKTLTEISETRKKSDQTEI
jgi:hypothetical protein